MNIFKRVIKEIWYRLRNEYTTEKLIEMGLEVGENFNRNERVIIDHSHCWLIKIGNNVTLAPNVHILAHDASTCNKLGYCKIGKVNIGDDVFIGAGSIVLMNTKIGNNVIVGAGSVVTKNLEGNGVYAGNPAKFICTYEEYIKKNRVLLERCNKYSDEFTIRKNIDNKKKEQMKQELEENIGFVI